MTQRESKIITVYPVASGNGAAYTTMQLAYALREKEKYKKIAVVDFDFASPVLAEGLHDDQGHGIDTLVDKLNGNLLTNESFLENMVKLKNDIHLLRGSRLAHRFPFVQPEHLDSIIGFLREEYDYILVSSSDQATDGGTPAALFNADHVLVVGRYTQKNEWRLKDAVACVKEFARTRSIAVVYNLYENQNKLDFSNRIPKSWEVCGTMAYNPTTIDNRTNGQGGLPFGKGKRSEEAKSAFENILNKFIEKSGEN